MTKDVSRSEGRVGECISPVLRLVLLRADALFYAAPGKHGDPCMGMTESVPSWWASWFSPCWQRLLDAMSATR